MRQARTDHDERAAGLGKLMAGGAQRGYVSRRHVLHLVDEQGDADAEVGRHRGGFGEELGEVDLQVT